MGFKLANVDGRSALVDGDHYFDVATISDGSLPSDPMHALAHSAELTALAQNLPGGTRRGELADVIPGPPVPQPQKSFAIGLNYLDHAAEGSMELPATPLVFTTVSSCFTRP